MADTGNNESRLFEHIRRLYPSREYLVLRHIRSGLGNNARTADALAIGLWRSRNVQVHGFEMKSSRTSWEQDLRNPAKAEEIAQYCHYWWIVAGDDSMVREAELPKGWGLYAVIDGELRVLVQAEELSPKSLAPDFMAYLIRGAIDQQVAALTDDERDSQYKMGYEKGFDDGSSESQKKNLSAIEALSEQLHDALKSTKELEKVLGVRFERLDKDGARLLGNLIRMYGIVGDHDKVPVENVRRLVDGHKFLMKQPIDKVVERLIAIKHEVQRTKDFIDAQLERIPEVQKRLNPTDMLE